MVFENESRPLTLAEMTVNSEFILSYLLSKGWSKNAVCGMLGNMQSESSINPVRWQSDISYDHDPYIHVAGHGYGLVQWTPFNKYTVWCRDLGIPYNKMTSNLARIDWEVENNQQWINSLDPKNRTFKEFSQSLDHPFDLAMAFISAYERPADPNQPIRGDQAVYWYETLTGEIIDPPETEKDNKIYHLWLSHALRW